MNQATTIANPSNGVLLTLIINVVLFIILMLVYCFGLENMILFNSQKKRKLLKQVMKQQEGTSLEQQQDDEFSEQFAAKWKRVRSFLVTATMSLIVPSMRREDAEQTVRKYGRNLAALIYYEQVMILLMLPLTIITLVVLVPLHTTSYQSADPIQVLTTNVSQDSLLAATSVNTILGEPNKLYAHVVLLCIFMIALAIAMTVFLCNPMHKYNYLGHDRDLHCQGEVLKGAKSLGLPQDKKVQQSNLSVCTELGMAYLVSPHVIELSNIPRDMICSEALKRMAELQFGIAPDCIIKAVLIYDMSKRYKLQNQLGHFARKIDQAFYQWELNKIKRPKTTRWFISDQSGWNLWKRYDAIEHYSEMHAKIARKIQHWEAAFEKVQRSTCEEKYLESTSSMNVFNFEVKEAQYMGQTSYAIKNAGFGYLILKSSADVQACMKKYNQDGLRISFHYAQDDALTHEEQNREAKKTFYHLYDQKRSNRAANKPMILSIPDTR